MSNKDKSKGSKAINGIIVILLLGVIGFSGYKLYEGFQVYWDNYLSEIEMMNKADRDEKTVNWKKLKAQNSDICGWLYCKGTKIDYPVVQGSDNSKYLNVGADGKYAVSGALFIDCNNKYPLKEPNTIIYGHHMNDGSMFHDLELWQDEKYLKKHPKFYFYTEDRNYKLSVVATEIVSYEDMTIYGVPFTLEEESEQFTEQILENSCTEPTVSCTAEDRFVTLSTCAYTFNGARSIIVCKVEPIDESIEEIEKDKPDPESKWTVFKRMVKDIISEGIKDIKGEKASEY